MESLSASTLSVVLKIREGAGFGFLTSPFIIVCSLNGNGLTSDPIPCSSNPTFESDFVWEADKKVLRSMRSRNYSIRVECFSDAKFRRSDKIGYILLSMKQQAQIANPALGFKVTFHWHKLLGVRSDAKSYKPEIYLSLFITEADSEVQTSIPKTPPPVLQASVNQGEATAKDMTITAAASRPTDGVTTKGSIQVGSPRDSDVHFKLSIAIASVYNLTSFAAVCDEASDKTDLRLEFAVFGDCFKTKDLSLFSKEEDEFTSVVMIKTQVQSLVAYFAQFPNLYFLLQSSGETVAKTPYNMGSFISEDKCENLVCGKVSKLHQQSRLELDNGASESKPHFTVSVSLELEKNKVNNPIKPFTISTNNKKANKNEVKPGNTKNTIRGVSCKTKTNMMEQPNEPVDHAAGAEGSKVQGSEPTETPTVKANDLIEINNPKSVDANQLLNQKEDPQKIWLNQNSVKNVMNDNRAVDPPPQQCLPQFVYPYFQTNFPYMPQDGRGDGCEVYDPRQRSPALTEQVTAKITDELAKKTYKELEEWKEKQKEAYKAELKKKLDKEVKRLTAEWLSRQNELEKEATNNIEESVSLSRQLHCTSAELRLRLEAVTGQQSELEKERRELEKKYSEKYTELREATKKDRADLRHQITVLTGEVEEMKAKNCCLIKENKILRSSHVKGDSGLGNSPPDKSTHLTEQQMTALLVDMKSLEEKLSAALESKEFFRKEWSRALREIHRMKTEREEQVRLQLQTQRQELDNLRLVGLITADEKASKDDLVCLKDLRNQIVQLGTPKSS